MVSAIEQKSDRLSSETTSSLIHALRSLPDDADEAIVDLNFIAASFFDALGYSSQERIPGFNTGNGKQAVDYALRNNTKDNNFLHTKKDPYLLV